MTHRQEQQLLYRQVAGDMRQLSLGEDSRLAGLLQLQAEVCEKLADSPNQWSDFKIACRFWGRLARYGLKHYVL